MTRQEFKKAQSIYRRTMRFASKHAVKHKLAMSIALPLVAAWGKKMAMLRDIHRAIEPQLAAKRKADDILDLNSSTVTLALENSPELYNTAKRSVEVYALHSPGRDCNPELSEIESALVYCASRNDSPDEPMVSRKHVVS